MRCVKYAIAESIRLGGGGGGWRHDSLSLMQSMIFGFLKTYLTLRIKSLLFIPCPAVNVNLGFIMFDYYSLLLLSKVFNYRRLNCHLQIWNRLKYYISLLKNIVKLITFKATSENTAVYGAPNAKPSF